jgi:hypothetical protein
MRRNPGFEGKMETKIDGVVTVFRMVTDRVTDIAPIRVFNALRVLDCHGTSPSNGLLADLTPLEEMNLAHLTHLNLSQTKVTDAEMVYFRDCKDLTVLYLGGDRVTDAGLANFKGCKNLTALDLHFSNVTDAGLAHFKDSKNLLHLDLSGTQVGDAGVAHFKECKDLLLLVLSGTQVTDAGLIYFKDCKNLAYLNLAWMKVTDTGLAHFKGIPLETICLTPKNFTKGLDILRDMKSLKFIGIDWSQV